MSVRRSSLTKFYDMLVVWLRTVIDRWSQRCASSKIRVFVCRVWLSNDVFFVYKKCFCFVLFCFLFLFVGNFPSDHEVSRRWSSAYARILILSVCVDCVYAFFLFFVLCSLFFVFLLKLTFLFDCTMFFCFFVAQAVASANRQRGSKDIRALDRLAVRHLDRV